MPNATPNHPCRMTRCQLKANGIDDRSCCSHSTNMGGQLKNFVAIACKGFEPESEPRDKAIQYTENSAFNTEMSWDNLFQDQLDETGQALVPEKKHHQLVQLKHML